MSKDLPQQPQQSEEVDLGQLFKMIGNMFDRLFKFIGNVLNNIYDLLLLLLIHLFKRLKWYALVIVVGVIIGYFLDKKTPYLYGAKMQVETNYKSARQVYENISFLNQLAGVDRDSVELGKRLKIAPSEAASIMGFSIEPNIDENDKMKLFSDFRAQLDSLTRSTYSYQDYIEGLSFHSFGTHQIEVVSTDKFIYSKINKSIVKELANNNFLNEIKEVTLNNLNLKEKALEQQDKILDSLRNIYINIRQSEAKKETQGLSNSGTNLFLGDADRQNLIIDETALLEKKKDINNEKLKIYKGLIENKYIVNIIAEFPAAGYEVGKLLDKAKIRVPALFVLVTFILFLGLGLNSFLIKQEERLLRK